MTTFKEAYRSFSDFAERQRKVKDALQLQIKETDRQISRAQTELKTEISKAFPALETFPHEKLTTAATVAGLPKNFTMLLSAMQSDSASAEGDWDVLVEKYGKPDEVQTRLDKTKADIAEQLPQYKTYSSQLERIQLVLEPLNYFMRVHMGLENPTVQQVQNLITYCEGFGIDKAFDPKWHAGRKALKSAQTYSDLGDVIETCKQRDAIGERYIKARSTISDLELCQSEDETIIKSFVRVDAKFLTPEKMLAKLHDEVLDAIFSERFASAVAREFDDEVAGPLFLPVAKIHNLQKVATTLQPALNLADSTLGKIEAPLSKLQKGASRAPSRSVDIDLDQVEEVIVANEKMGKYYTDNAKKVRHAVSDSRYSSRNYQDAGYSDMNMLYMSNYMLAPAYSDPNCDPTYVNCIVTGMDPGSVSSLSDANPTSLGALSNAFDASTGMPHISTHNIPDLNSIPSIPNVSVPTVDSGSSGGGWSPGGGSYGGDSSHGGYSSGGYGGGGGGGDGG